MALTKDGRVYEWTEDCLPNLTDFPEEAGMTQISAGLAHCMALTSCGKVYCWGVNGDGQLGTGDLDERVEPSKVIPDPKLEIEEKIVAICCGRNSSFAVTEGGDVRCL